MQPGKCKVNERSSHFLVVFCYVLTDDVEDYWAHRHQCKQGMHLAKSTGVTDRSPRRANEIMCRAAAVQMANVKK